MLRITIAAVGKARKGPEHALYEAYAGRLQWPLRVWEVEVPGQLSVEERRRREGERLQAVLPVGATVIALDRRGEALGSVAFAHRIDRWQESGVRDLAFVIGGAEGLSTALTEAAHGRFAFGPMTWPHMLARVMLVEQLFRAQSILSGHPYHRD